MVVTPDKHNQPRNCLFDSMRRQPFNVGWGHPPAIKALPLISRIKCESSTFYMKIFFNLLYTGSTEAYVAMVMVGVAS